MSRNAIIEAVEQGSMKKDIPEFNVGDTISVSCKIVDESGKERVQTFTGTVIARKGTGLSETVSIHRVAYGEGMERVFYLHSPLLVSLEVVRRGHVRRSKLYYLRGKSGKAAKVRGRFGVMQDAQAQNQKQSSAVQNQVESEADVTA